MVYVVGLEWLVYYDFRLSLLLDRFNPGEPNTCFIFRKNLNCVYNGYYRLTKHKKVKKKKIKDIFRAHVNLYRY